MWLSSCKLRGRDNGARDQPIRYFRPEAAGNWRSAKTGLVDGHRRGENHPYHIRQAQDTRGLRTGQEAPRTDAGGPGVYTDCHSSLAGVGCIATNAERSASATLERKDTGWSSGFRPRRLYSCCQEAKNADSDPAGGHGDPPATRTATATGECPRADRCAAGQGQTSTQTEGAACDTRQLAGESGRQPRHAVRPDPAGIIGCDISRHPSVGKQASIGQQAGIRRSCPVAAQGWHPAPGARGRQSAPGSGHYKTLAQRTIRASLLRIPVAPLCFPVAGRCVANRKSRE